MPVDNDALSTFVPILAGEFYHEILLRMHQVLRPETYLEIGCYQGASLALAACKVIAVDPALRIMGPAYQGKEELHLYQMPSDRFFARYNPARIFGQPVDFAFLDGMHIFEFLLRDFINTEKSCKRNSVIILHDCIPVDVHITTRLDDTELRAGSTQPDWWTGDVWKILPILKKFRPELQVHAVDASPTGLVIITNLDPASTVLTDNYFSICAQYGPILLVDYGLNRFIDEINIVSAAEFTEPLSLANRFWL